LVCAWTDRISTSEHVIELCANCWLSGQGGMAVLMELFVDILAVHISIYL